jgi:tRNA(Phe) wybutosine-synthesizing methylase Tyw3
VVARDIESAKGLLKLAHEAGFKRSGIHAITPERIVLEILSTEQMEAPLARDGQTLADDNYLEFLVEVANTKLMSGRKKLAKLERVLS